MTFSFHPEADVEFVEAVAYLERKINHTVGAVQQLLAYLEFSMADNERLKGRFEMKMVEHIGLEPMTPTLPVWYFKHKY